jgi:hypothetical protein
MIFSTTRKLKNIKKTTSAHPESTDLIVKAYKKYPSGDTLPLNSLCHTMQCCADKFARNLYGPQWAMQSICLKTQ